MSLTVLIRCAQVPFTGSSEALGCFSLHSHSRVLPSPSAPMATVPTLIPLGLTGFQWCHMGSRLIISQRCQSLDSCKHRTKVTQRNEVSDQRVSMKGGLLQILQVITKDLRGGLREESASACLMSEALILWFLA